MPAASLSNVGVPRLRVGVPLVVYLVALLNGGSGGLCVVPVLVGSGALHCAAPLRIVRSLRIVPVPLLSCVVVFVVGGEVWWGNCALLSSSPSHRLCSLSQHCWFRVGSL